MNNIDVQGQRQLSSSFPLWDCWNVFGVLLKLKIFFLP